MAASVATLLVMVIFALVLHHQMQSAIQSWERRQAAALAHHLGAMLDTVPREERSVTLEQLEAPLRQFGVSARLTSPGEAPEARRVHVPLTDGAALEVHTTGAGTRLAARLASLYLGLTGGVLAALLLAVQGSIYWGLTRPLQAVKQQIAQMHRGRWWAPAQPQSVAEVANLGSDLESLGQMLESRIGQWVEAERRAGFELARSRLRLASGELRRDIELIIADLSSNEELSRTSSPQLGRLLRALEQLDSQLSQPLEDLGLGPPEWDRSTARHTDEPSASASVGTGTDEAVVG